MSTTASQGPSRPSHQPVTSLPRPSWWLAATELGRASVEVAAWHAVRHALPTGGHGAGRPVLVLPGFLAGDVATAALRAHLRTRGFHTHRWTLGLNRGFTDAILDGLAARLEELHARHGRPVSIVGWSLGGLMARWLAHTHTDAVERVVCLGSPWRPEIEQNRVSSTFRAAERYWGFSERTGDVTATIRRPLPVPSVAIFSPWDGLLHRDGCRLDDDCDETGDTGDGADTEDGASTRHRTENVVVPASHCGLSHNPAALVAVADRLEVPLERWRPFRWSEALAGSMGVQLRGMPSLSRESTGTTRRRSRATRTAPLAPRGKAA